jgi:hypothetical protein
MLCVMGEDKEAQQQVALKTQREPLMVRVCWGKGYLLPKIYIYAYAVTVYHAYTRDWRIVSLIRLA